MLDISQIRLGIIVNYIINIWSFIYHIVQFHKIIRTNPIFWVLDLTCIKNSNFNFVFRFGFYCDVVMFATNCRIIDFGDGIVHDSVY